MPTRKDLWRKTDMDEALQSTIEQMIHSIDKNSQSILDLTMIIKGLKEELAHLKKRVVELEQP